MSEEKKVIEATIASVQTTKKDGTPLVTRKGQPWLIVGIKQDDGTWLNLSSFDSAHHPLLVQGAAVKIAYTESLRTDEFGEPALYNGAQQWNRNITAVKALGGANPATPAAPKGNIPPEISVRQTAANCSIQKAETVEQFDEWFDHILARLLDKPTEEFDKFMGEAKDKLGAEEDKKADEKDDDIPW